MAVYRRREAGDDPDKPTGPWEVAVRAPGGKQVVRRLDPRTGERITGKRHAQDVERWLHADLHGGDHAHHPTATVREFARRWWRQHVRANVNVKGHPNYRLHLEQHILPIEVPVDAHGTMRALGDIELGQLRVSTIDAWLGALKTSGRQPPTVKRARAILSSMLGKAVKWEVIGANPCASSDRVKVVKKQRMYLTTTQVLAIADATRNLRDRTMVIVQAFTGLRPSELLGLSLEHIHLDDDTPYLYVAWQLSEAVRRKDPATGKLRLVEPATMTTPKDHELGAIELPAFVADTLREYLAAGAPHPPIATPDGAAVHLAFAQADGTPLSLRTWRRSNFAPATIRAGLGVPVLDAAGRPVMTKAVAKQRKAKPMLRARFTPQDLRHFFASFCRSLPEGVGTPDYVCARMRHHDPAFTMREYGDLWATAPGPVLAAMDAVLAAATA